MKYEKEAVKEQPGGAGKQMWEVQVLKRRADRGRPG